MITKIEVDGFKSLKDFSLSLNQGLNILVGPNGAGKTNVILFFEFLSNLISKQAIGNAVSQVGGAGAIFQKVNKEDYVDKISSKIYGCYQESSKKFLIYEYSFEIKISFEKDDVFYSKQEIKMATSNTFWSNPNRKSYVPKWDLHIKYSQSNEFKPEIFVEAFNKRKIKSPFIDSTKSEGNDSFKKFILSQNPIHNSIIVALVPLTGGWSYPIHTDLIGGETFNIVPSKVRELEDSAAPSGIKKDGSGLATTLYAMKKSKGTRDEFIGFYLGFEERRMAYNPKTLDKIVDYLKLANSTITSLDVDNDPFNNKLIVKITIKTGNYEATLPLSAMSDGTIKWLTLITAILTSKTIFSIEEPENFLHPWMQAEIAQIMRNHLEEKKNPAFVLMTTHSESLLNNARPEEIILVDLKGGRTVAKRIPNMKAIKEEISDSGFGLGHFYFSNSLSYE